MNCAQCKKKVEGAAAVMGEAVLHLDCQKLFSARLDGRKFDCPICGTRGEVDDLDHPIRKRVKTDLPNCAYGGCRGCRDCIDGELTTVGYKKKTCALCEGFGYTKTQAKPITKVVGYEL